MSHGTHMNEARHTHESLSHVTHVDASCLTYESVLTLIRDVAYTHRL